MNFEKTKVALRRGHTHNERSTLKIRGYTLALYEKILCI